VRWLPLSGLAFVVCFALAVGLYGSGAGSDPAGIVAFYGSRADRLRQIGGFSVLLAGCVFLLLYVAVVAREHVREEPLATVALLSGSASTLLIAISNALWAASAFAGEIEPNFRIGPAAHLLIEDAGFVVLVTAMVLAIPFVASVSVASWRSRRLPTWFAAMGGVCVAGLAGAYWYWPLVAYLIWIGCGSALLLRQQGEP
jgi:hypothetical protein